MANEINANGGKEIYFILRNLNETNE